MRSYDALYKMQLKVFITRVGDWYNGLVTYSEFQLNPLECSHNSHCNFE